MPVKGFLYTAWIQLNDWNQIVKLFFSLVCVSVKQFSSLSNLFVSSAHVCGLFNFYPIDITNIFYVEKKNEDGMKKTEESYWNKMRWVGSTWGVLISRRRRRRRRRDMFRKTITK